MGPASKHCLCSLKIRSREELLTFLNSECRPDHLQVVKLNKQSRVRRRQEAKWLNVEENMESPLLKGQGHIFSSSASK